jgi:outer membrane biosynthesis protein TonB
VSELSGAAAIGIETVEWLAGASGNATVRVTGRWRRRRPATGGPTTLVIEVDGARRRFPAMPEPPSLAGAAPGMWRLSFAVPGELAPDLGARAWLQFGTVVVPLPRAVQAPRTQDVADQRSSPPELTLVTKRSAGEPSPTDLAARVLDLERDLVAARARREELLAALADRDRTRLLAEQRAHAEEALRRDLARKLAATERRAERAREALGDLAAAEDRIRTLEHELRLARRRTDEAEQIAATAAARRRGRPAPSTTATADRPRLRLEHELTRRREATAARVVAEPARPPRPAPAAGPPPSVPVQERTPPPAPEPPPSVPVHERTPPPAPEPPLPPHASAGEPPQSPSPRPGLQTNSALQEAGAAHAPEGDLVGALRRELGVRAAEDASLRARLVDAETRLAARVLLERRTAVVLGQLRHELDGLREAVGRERALREAAERRADELQAQLSGQRSVSRGAYDAISDLRDVLDRLSRPAMPAVAWSAGLAGEPQTEMAAEPETEAVAEPPPAADRTPEPEPEPPPAADRKPEPEPEREPAPDAAPALMEPARLNDALSRLRETISPQEPPDQPQPEPAPVIQHLSLREALTRPSLDRAFRGLVRADAAAAGRLLLELLPLEPAVYPSEISYDLVLGSSRGCVAVSLRQGAATIELRGAPRARGDVDFQVLGDPARIARLMVAGRVRRRLDRRVARVRGARAGVAALTALLSMPLDLESLLTPGIRLDPIVTLGLVASMIDPRATAGRRFTVVHRPPDGVPVYLEVRDGRQPRVSRDGRRPPVSRDGPGSPVTTTISCAGDDLLRVLAGHDVQPLEVGGDVEPLSLLRGWIKLAQSA